MKKSDVIKVSSFALLFFALLNFAPNSLFSQLNNKFSAPWENSHTPIIIDAFHKNSIDWEELKKDMRVVGIIHKATEGTRVSDPKYYSRKTFAKRNGYKWGTLHLEFVVHSTSSAINSSEAFLPII